MKSLLAKLAMRKFVGLYLGEHEVSVSVVAVTPLGPVETASISEPCQPNELLGTIERLLNSLQGTRRRRLQVAIGVPNSRLFFGTRPLRNSDGTAEGMMAKLLCSSNVTTDDLTIDMIKSNVDKVPVGSVGACRKKYMAAVLGVLQTCGAVIVRTEPAPCALVRSAAQQCRPPRRAKTLLNIFLGEQEGIAVLTVGSLPLAWRSFALPSFSEGMAILSAARTLLSQSQYYEMSTPLDYAVVHGRPELHDRLQKEGLPTEIGVRMVWNAGPAYTGATVAQGLALGAAQQNAVAFDLSRTMKPRPALRDIFPWGQIACGTAIMVFMALMMMRHSDRVNSAYLAAKAECDGNKALAAADASKLQKEKADLTKKIDAVRKFIDGRVIWTAQIRGLSAWLPSEIKLGQWQGTATKAGSGRMQFAASAMLTPLGALPPQVGEFVTALRTKPALKSVFPQTELMGLRQSGKKAGGTADFNIVCQAEKGKK
jgi:hypothetical protein